MNYLAHAYLSFDHPGLLVGNLVSDFVKGKKKFDYPRNILDGINLHRAIDDFTDAHKITKEAKQVFQPAYGLYSGAFLDIVYDYFIANDASLWADISLEAFSQNVYSILDDQVSVLPAGFTKIFPSMKRHNWLLNYRTTEGIERSFEGLVYRARYMSDSSTAYSTFLNNRIQLQKAYESFFPELVNFTLKQIEQSKQ